MAVSQASLLSCSARGCSVRALDDRKSSFWGQEVVFAKSKIGNVYGLARGSSGLLSLKCKCFNDSYVRRASTSAAGSRLGTRQAWPMEASPQRSLSGLMRNEEKDRDVKSRAWAMDIEYADDERDRSLLHRRVVFDFNRWNVHKSTSRYFRHIMSIPGSRVFRCLVPILGVVTAFAALVVGWNMAVNAHMMPAWAPVLRCNVLPFSLSSAVLSLLLVFRTNSSYNRFDEARKMWGLMLNRSRDLTRQALTYITRMSDEGYLHKFLTHLQAFSIVFKHHVQRNEVSLDTELRAETRLSERDIQDIMQATHRPNYVLQVMSEALTASKVDNIVRQSMDTNLTTFADVIGGCERLLRTPIPLSYTRLTSRFVLLWHFLLPFGLWDALGPITIAATFFSASALLCIDEVGVMIEEPFSILALDGISRTARTNIQEMIDHHQNVKARIMEHSVLPGRDCEPASVI